MSEVKPKSIYDGMEYLYAEQLKDKRVKVTIKSIKETEIVGDGGRESIGYVLEIAEKPKKLIVDGATVRRQLAIACGTELIEEMVGKQIILYPVKSKRSIAGQAIRIAKV